MMSGQSSPDSGTITLGETVKLASVDQFRDAMDSQQNRLGSYVRRLDIMKTVATLKCRRAYVAASTSKASIRQNALANCPAVKARLLASSAKAACGRQRPAASTNRRTPISKPLRALENAPAGFLAARYWLSSHDRCS
ncbi:hypothetical protein KCP76_13335 [Salmonella enterica subsp. enterica serovar Weltevreden]|nr:hypothetical protein KCP76_13335 [Salmonella enterica subsp. enterica serovar Weltevreden]